MSVLSIKDIKKSFGAEDILTGVSMHLEEGERAGLVGVNGCGKTTLLEIISGRMHPDSGTVSISKGLGIGYLEQVQSHQVDVGLLDAALGSRPEVMSVKDKLNLAAERAGALAGDGGDGYEAAVEEYGALLEEFESAGGYAYENEVSGALIGLGFDREDFDRLVSTLSGGERTRLGLAMMLVAGHGLLLLDEPTNHLDIAAVAWLEEFLLKYAGTVLMVSHDRYFLDRVATRIFELDRGAVESFHGNYSRYRQEKQKRDEARRKQYELAHARFEKEKEYIDRMRAGVNARQAKGREKRLARFELPDAPAGPKRQVRIGFTDAGRTSDTVVSTDSVGKSFGGVRILKDVSLTIRRGERVGIVGPNGSGKSTLLKIIMGELDPDEGGAQLGGNVYPGYYAQGLEGLDESNTVIEELWEASPLSTEQEIRDLLGAFLFTGDDAHKKVVRLSGGEKGRLAISKMVLKGANLLVLDEPTNHLDIPSREALEAAIEGFRGSVISVSHDRFFLDRFAGRILEVDDGRLTEHWGNYSDYAQKKRESTEIREESVSEGRRAWEDGKERRALERKKEKDERLRREAISGMEEEIGRVEERIMELETRLADPAVFGDYAKVADLTGEYEDLKLRRDSLYEQLDKELA